MIIVCIGGGESLTRADAEYCKGRAKVLGINDAYRIACCDWLYAADYGWWKYHIGAVRTSSWAELWTCDKQAALDFDLHRVKHVSKPGLNRERGKVNGGYNGGYQGMNLAYHFLMREAAHEERKILLLGYDMGGKHWFGHHPPEIPGPGHRANYPMYASTFPALARDLEVAGVEVVNCSRQTTLTCFRRSTIEAEL